MSGVREDWFPTSVWCFDEPDCEPLNDQLERAIRCEQAADATGITKSNQLGWHSQDKLHQRDEFAPLLDRVKRNVDEVVAFEQWDLSIVQPRITSAWAIVNPPGANNALHNHPGAVLSGVYYVRAADNCGQISFRDPREQAVMVAPPVREFTPWTFRSVRYPPRPGRMLIFPAWLLHGVEPNSSDHDRMVISFNIST